MVATNIRRKFLSIPDASSSSCLFSSSMTSYLQHVSGLCSMSAPDAVPSLSFNSSALHCHDELFLSWCQSQTHPRFATTTSGRRNFTSCKIFPHSAISSVQPFPVVGHPFVCAVF
ncbi:hypothetical protein P692DRAFT_20403453 [Suillus brevipes Sb2]|nr:hypothetical protein P692DRAFT_20403453 [Suillus brevipes Sb2]